MRGQCDEGRERERVKHTYESRKSKKLLEKKKNYIVFFFFPNQLNELLKSYGFCITRQIKWSAISALLAEKETQSVFIIVCSL